MIKQNPFSVYDFLGYLIPGSLFLYSFYIIDYLKSTESIEIDNLFNSLNDYEHENIFLFIIISYSIGHLLSFSSSITVEKYANWRYNYPSKYLLDLPHQGYWSKGLDWKSKLWRIVIITILFPCILLDLLIGKLLDFKRYYTNSVDDMLKDIITFKINALLHKLNFNKIEGFKEKYRDGKGNDYDFHRIVTHYAFEYSKNHQSKMSNYVALYGFLRNLCLIFNLITIYFITRVCLYLTFNIVNIFTILVLLSITYLAFMAFMKFYRRYTLEGFMVVVSDESLGKN